jgi:hypothetical protein
MIYLANYIIIITLFLKDRIREENLRILKNIKLTIK